MTPFSLDSFYNSLISFLANGFPYMKNEELDKRKHPNRVPLHLQDAVFNNLPVVRNENTLVFDIGNPMLESSHPYYHILEDSEVIQVRGKGTKKSKGSQEQISDKSARDYGIVNWNGKTFTQEYRKNVRGARSRASKGRQVIVDSNGVVTKINQNATYYTNVHYHYLEKAIQNAIPELCAQFGLRAKRVQDTKLSDEWDMQNKTNSGETILDIFNSFN